MNRYIIISILLVFISCGKEKKSTGFILWETTLPSESNFNTIYNQMVTKDYLITLDESEGIIICHDKESANEIWRWKQANEEYGGNVDGFSGRSYIFNDILVVGENNISYGIDINSGNTVWSNKSDLSGSKFISGNKDLYAYKEGIFNEKVWIMLGNVNDGSHYSIYNFERSDMYNINSGLPYLFSYEGSDFAVFTKHKWGYDTNNSYVEDQWLHLYNLTEDKLEWVSDTIPLKTNISGIAGKRPVFHDGQILLANDAIYSYNIEDGSLEWSKYYGNSFVLSTHLSADYGRVYGNNASGYMVSLDVHTGEEYFNVTTGGSASRIEINDGKVYIGALTGAVDEDIQIRDAYTGELLLSIEPPYMNDNNIRYFDNVITVDPETGYIYTADHVNILCFDPQL